jgi:signal transduction histidine kinase/CheY-like chemotaxis protein
MTGHQGDLDKLRLLYDSMSEMLALHEVVLDADGRPQDYRIVECNTAYERITGIPRERALGALASGLYGTNTAPYLEVFGEVAMTGIPKTLETHFGPMDKWFFISIFSPARGQFGTITMDITEQKRAQAERDNAQNERRKLEDQLRQAQKMEAVGRLAGGVAHDFNNALTGIMGSASLGLLDCGPEQRSARYFNEILHSAEGTAGLIRQLLAFSRKQIIDPKVFNLADLVGGMHVMLSRLIGENIRLEVAQGGKVGQVKADASQLEQVLVNLAINARDAMPDGGRLILETESVTLGEEYCAAHAHVSPGRYVMLAVSDTGHGMPPEVRERCFEPFFTTKSRDKGTGLGLSMVYGLVKQAGGSVEVYSEVGHGTTFKIYLPEVQEAPSPPKPRVPMLTMPTGTETVLLVEDEPAVKDIAARVLQRLGYRVLPFLTAEAALDALPGLGDPIHLLLTDVMLPGMNGGNLAKKVVELRPGIKVLFTSGYTENNIVHHGVLDPGVNFVGKPYSLQVLAQRVREVLDA